MMRLLAQFLFWTGRVESIVILLLVIHLLVILLLRGKSLTRVVTAGWLILFLALSLTIFYDTTIGPLTDGVDYLLAHLYGGLWDNSQALAGILQRWQNILLPIYFPWLTVWAVGLLGILFFSAVQHRAAMRSY